jgi:hypothetical protein
MASGICRRLLSLPPYLALSWGFLSPCCECVMLKTESDGLPSIEVPESGEITVIIKRVF